MKQKLLEMLAKSREHIVAEQKRLDDTLAVLDYEIECVTNSKND